MMISKRERSNIQMYIGPFSILLPLTLRKKDNIIQKNVLLGTDVSNRIVPNATKKERKKCQNLYTYTYTVNSVY